MKILFCDEVSCKFSVEGNIAYRKILINVKLFIDKGYSQILFPELILKSIHTHQISQLRNDHPLNSFHKSFSNHNARHTGNQNIC